MVPALNAFTNSGITMHGKQDRIHTYSHNRAHIHAVETVLNAD